jgi:hypothetical protein
MGDFRGGETFVIRRFLTMLINLQFLEQTPEWGSDSWRFCGKYPVRFRPIKCQRAQAKTDDEREAEGR